MHPNTHSEQIVDKNGVLTTRHKRNINLSAIKSLPTLGNAITGTARIASTTPAERANFDFATALINTIAPTAKTIAVVEQDEKLALVAVDGEVVEPGRTEFLISTLLSKSGIGQGVYKLSGSVDEAKATKGFLGTVDATRYHKSRQSNLSDIESIAAFYSIIGATDPEDIEYMASDEFGDVSIRQLAILSPHASQEMIDSYVDDEDSMVRAFVARKTQDSEIISKLMKDDSESVLDDAVRSPLTTTEDLDLVYNKSRLFSTREAAVRSPRASRETIVNAYENDWNYRVIHAAAGKYVGDFSDKWDNTTEKSYLKDDVVKSAAKAAGRYARYYSKNGTEARVDEAILTDDEARAIAWRFSSRASKHSDAFKAFDNGEDFSLQNLIVEAARFKSLRLDERPYGLMWDIDDYSDAIIGWARNKQGRHKTLTAEQLQG